VSVFFFFFTVFSFFVLYLFIGVFCVLQLCNVSKEARLFFLLGPSNPPRVFPIMYPFHPLSKDLQKKCVCVCVCVGVSKKRREMRRLSFIPAAFFFQIFVDFFRKNKKLSGGSSRFFDRSCCVVLCRLFSFSSIKKKSV